jgi:hypothetical protein
VPATAVNCPHCNIALNLQQSAVSPTRESSSIGIVVVVMVGALGLLMLLAGFAMFGFVVRSPGPVAVSAGSTTAIYASPPGGIEVEESPLLIPPTSPPTGEETSPPAATESAP